MSAFRQHYVEEYNTTLVELPYKICFLHNNIYITDKHFPFRKLWSVREKIDEIIFIFPTFSEDNEIINQIDKKEVNITVLNYGNEHEPKLDSRAKEVAQRMSENRDKTYLIVCNSGFQRTIPFVVNYFITHCSSEFPTVESAVEYIMGALEETFRLPKQNVHEVMIANVKKVLGL